MSIIPQKLCNKCGQLFPSTTEYFSRHKGHKDGLNSECHQCNRARVRQYRNENPEKVAASKREDRAKHKDRIRKQQQAWVQNNPEKNRAIKHRYTENHPDKVKKNQKTSKRRRRAVLRNLPFDFYDTDWQHCLEYWGYSCCVCGRKAGLWHILAREHWIAIEDHRPDNPGTVPSNILPMCHSVKGASPDDAGCNNVKRNKDPVEWLNKRLGKRKAKAVIERIQEYFSTVR